MSVTHLALNGEPKCRQMPTFQGKPIVSSNAAKVTCLKCLGVVDTRPKKGRKV